MLRASAVLHSNQLKSITFQSRGHPTVAAAIAETITALRELEQVCFRASRNSAAGLYFSQQRLLLMRHDIGKAPSRSDWLALAALGEKAAGEKAV